MRQNINLSRSILSVVVDMSEGNPGAMSVLAETVKLDSIDSFVTILSLDDMNIRGEQVWVGFKYFSDSDLVKFIQNIKDRSKDMVDMINKECLYDGFTEIAVTSGGSNRVF